jgi:hypothetical protein
MNFTGVQGMEENNYTGLIPPNESGKEITAKASTDLPDIIEAHAMYAIAKERLLNVNNWHEIAGTLSADFTVTDEQGKEVDRKVRKGDHFKVSIPGPGSKAGEGYDWVQVEDIKEVLNDDVESTGLIVRPASNPQNDDSEVAHFYAEQSTSSFIVTREGNKVTAGIYDRNIEPNTDSSSAADKVRNTTVGLGAKYGFSRLQWQALADALIKKEE